VKEVTKGNFDKRVEPGERRRGGRMRKLDRKTGKR